MVPVQQLIDLAIVALVALSCGAVLSRLRQPPVVGYILAGVVLGPSVSGFVRADETVALLAELGVLMLLFVVGMELSLRGFRTVWVNALAAMGAQLVISLGVMALLSLATGWPPGATVLIGFVVAVSSTAVAIKLLEEVGELRTHLGRMAVGVLIAQDLAVVPMLLTLGFLAEGRADFLGLLRLAVAVGFLALLIIYLSRRKRVMTVTAEDSPGMHADLVPLVALSACFGAAGLAGVLGLSPAYGAFLVGLAIGNSGLRAEMLANTLPIQGVLMMMFFLSIGLLIDFAVVARHWETVLLLVAFITLLKTAINIGIFRWLKLGWPEAVLIAAVMAQVGEFSFVLAGEAGRLKLIEEEDYLIIITVTALSLTVSPAWLEVSRRLHAVIDRRRMARDKRPRDPAVALAPPPQEARPADAPVARHDA